MQYNFGRINDLNQTLVSPTVYLSSGVYNLPAYTFDPINGTITIDPSIYLMYTNPDGVPPIQSYSLPGGTFNLTDSETNYLYVDNNGGSPIIICSTDRSAINQINVIPIFTIFRKGSEIKVLDFDEGGKAKADKLSDKDVRCKRFEVEIGACLLSESSERIVKISDGHIWLGHARNHLDAFDSSINKLYLCGYSGGTWTETLITKYSNSQYNDGTNFQTLLPNKYAVNWIYRCPSNNENSAYIVLGNGNLSLAEANAAKIPGTLPKQFQTNTFLVGRIIVKQAATIATVIESAFEKSFVGTSTIDNQFGDTINGNYSEFESDGSLVAHGSATCTRDELGDVSRLKVQGTGVSFDTTELTLDFTSSSDLNDFVIAIFQINHDWKVGSIIKPHIHFFQTQNAIPNVLIQYRWQRNQSGKTTAWTNYKLDTLVVPYVSGTLNNILGNPIGITPPTDYSLSDILQMKLIRDNANASTIFSGKNSYTGDLEITAFDIHIEVDMLGSREEYSK